jgi:hypothetical protein
MKYESKGRYIKLTPPLLLTWLESRQRTLTERLEKQFKENASTILRLVL